MRHFKVVFGKMTRVLSPGQPAVMEFCEQHYFTENENITITEIPAGYMVISVCQFLPDVKIQKLKKDEASKN